METYHIIEASHLFRAGDKFQTQFFVMDVVNFLQRQYFPDTEAKILVLHGSVKDEQAKRYSSALERHGVQVIRMKPIASKAGEGRHYFKPTYYIHQLMGVEIPQGSHIVLIGFHNVRYQTFLQKYFHDYKISMAAFKTPSKKLGWMSIPQEFSPFLHHSIDLDNHVADIKAEFKGKNK